MLVVFIASIAPIPLKSFTIPIHSFTKYMTSLRNKVTNQTLAFPISDLYCLVLHKSQDTDMTSGLTVETWPNVDGMMTMRKKGDIK